MKKSLKLLTAALMICVSIAGLAACGKKEPGTTDTTTKIGLSSTNGVDVYAYDAAWNISNKLTGTADAQGRKVEVVNGVITVTAAATDVDIELDLAPFYGQNAAHKGTNFYFTRSDVKVTPTGTELLKGYAWYETVAGNSATRKYKQLGYETDITKEDITKGDIQELEDRKGEIRMYILNHGAHAGRHVTYINKDVDPDATKLTPYFNETITFTFHGHNGTKAELKVKVIQPVSAA